jgi:hypothetical protein
VKSAVMGVLFIFFKLMIESKNIELFYATNSKNIELFCTYFFLYAGASINFTFFSFYAYLDYNHL